MSYIPASSSPFARALLLALALTALLFGASRADAATFAPTYDQVFSNPTAGAATGLTATITKSANASNIKQIVVNEPPELGPNFPSFGSAPDMCPAASLTTTSFNPAGCPASAKVGTLTITSPTYSHTATGIVYLVGKSPVPSFGVDINPASASGNPAGLTARFGFSSSLPQVDPACDPLIDPSGSCQTQLRYTSVALPNIKLSKVVLSVNGPDRAGSGGTLSGKLWVFAPAPCTSPVKSKATFTPVSGAATTVTDSDALNGCGPSFNQTLATPAAGSDTAATWSWSNAGQTSNIKTLAITELPQVGVNFAAVGNLTDMCPSSSMLNGTSTFDPSSCPATAKIGTFTVNSPAYPGPATGNAYLIDKSPIPWIGVDVNPASAAGNPAGVTLRFAFIASLPLVDPTCDPNVTGFCQSQLRFTSSGLPNVATTQATLSITRQLFTLASPPCTSPLLTSAAFTPFAGSVSTVVDSDPITGC